MALFKPIVTPNGIPTKYHRIALITIDVNQACTILIHSYIEPENRQYEKDYANGLIEDPVFPFVYDEYLQCDYDENMSVKKAYEWLKQQPEFEGAVDA